MSKKLNVISRIIFGIMLFWLAQTFLIVIVRSFAQQTVVSYTSVFVAVLLITFYNKREQSQRGKNT